MKEQNRQKKRFSGLHLISRFKSVRNAMLFSFCLIVVLTLAIFLLFSMSYTERTVISNSREYTMQLVEQVNGDIDSYISYMENISQLVTENEDLQKFLQGDDEAGGRLQAQFATIMGSREDIYGIAVFCRDGRYILNAGEDPVNPYAELEKMEWYRDTMENPGEAVISSSHVQNIVAGRYRWVITVSKALTDPETGETAGVFFVDLNYSSIKSLCENIDLGTRGYLFIVDGTGRIIYHPKQQLLYSGMKSEEISKVIESGTGSFLTGGESRQLYSICRSEKTGWSVAGVSSVSEFIRNRGEIQLAYIAIAALLLAVALLLALWLSGEITRPVKDLERSMKEVQQGNFQAGIRKPEGNDEIASLGRSFAIMTEKIGQLMEENVQEQRAKRKNELRVLQAQINPHFLYNTLDSIIWMAESKKTEEVVEMTSSLAKLLRQSISNEDEIVTIAREIEYTKNYLAIQKMRYRDQLEYRIDVDDEILNQPIVKLVIQPLVENAIYHGIKYVEGKGMLLILGSMRNGRVVLSIQDNGPGMDEKTLAHILEKPAPDAKKPRKSARVGVYNVHNRLQLYYGKEYGLSYESAPGQGTCVYVAVPARREGGAHEEF